MNTREIWRTMNINPEKHEELGTWIPEKYEELGTWIPEKYEELGT